MAGGAAVMNLAWKAVAKLQERTMRDLSAENDKLRAGQAMQSALIDVADRENKRLRAQVDELQAEVQRLSLFVALHSATKSDPLQPPYIVTCETGAQP